MLEEGIRKDWFESTLISVLAVVAVIALAALRHPRADGDDAGGEPVALQGPVFLAGTLIGGVMFAMLMAITFLLPVFMQTLLGFDAMQSGIALMPRSLVMMVVVPIVGRIYNKVSAAHRRRVRHHLLRRSART